MARPRGEIRNALVQAFERLEEATIREVAPAAGINPASPSEYRMVVRTVSSMVQCGELMRCGRFKPAGSRAWQGIYTMAMDEGTAEPGVDLQHLLRAWGAVEVTATQSGHE